MKKLFLSLALALAALTSKASTVVGYLMDPTLSNVTTTVTFKNSQPAIHNTTNIVYTQMKTVTATNGILPPTVLGPGNYTMQIGPRNDVLTFSLQDDTNTYQIATLIAAGTLFTYPYSPVYVQQVPGGQSLFVSTNGNDATGLRGDASKPFATPKAAVNAAQAGDTVIIFPGTYTNQNNLGKNLVNLYTYPGAIISYIELGTNGVGGNTNIFGRGFIDDRAGPLNVTVSGHGTWIYSLGTNSANWDTNADDYFDYTNSIGAVHLENFASVLNWESDDCYIGNISAENTLPFFFIYRSKYSNIKIRDGYDLYNTNTITINTPDEGAVPFTGHAQFWLWESGESHFKFTHIHPMYGANPFWWDELPITHTNYEGEAWIDGDISEEYAYINGSSHTWRTWWNLREMIPGLSHGETAFTIVGPGLHYINADKIQMSGKGQYAIGMQGATNTGDLQVWVNAQAMKSDVGWFDIGCGSLYANILDYEDTGANGGTIDGGIKVDLPTSVSSNAVVKINGGILTCNNGRPFALYSGSNTFTGMEIRSTNNSCVYITNGYSVFNGCLMISKVGSNSVNSGAIAANVGLVGGMQNTTKSANVTVQPGAAVVDSNLK